MNPPSPNALAARRYRARHPERRAALDARRYAAHGDRLRARSSEYKKRDRRRGLLTDAKKRARAKGLEFSITVDNIVWPASCPVFHTPMIYSGDRGGRATDTSPSIDRIDPRLGYTPDNVQVVSWLANRIKTNATPAQLMAVAMWANRLPSGV